MKFKKIMLITLLLLAVLTIGAVSASDDAALDNVTASDDVDVIADDDGYGAEYSDEEIITDVDDPEYDSDAFVASMTVPNDTASGAFVISVESDDDTAEEVILFNAPIIGVLDNHWQHDEFENLVCFVYLSDLDNLTFVNDGDTISFDFLDDEGEPVSEYCDEATVTRTDSYIKFGDDEDDDEEVNINVMEDPLSLPDDLNVPFASVIVSDGLRGFIVIYVGDEGEGYEYGRYYYYTDIDDLDGEPTDDGTIYYITLNNLSSPGDFVLENSFRIAFLDEERDEFDGSSYTIDFDDETGTLIFSPIEELEGEGDEIEPFIAEEANAVADDLLFVIGSDTFENVTGILDDEFIVYIFGEYGNKNVTLSLSEIQDEYTGAYAVSVSDLFYPDDIGIESEFGFLVQFYDDEGEGLYYFDADGVVIYTSPYIFNNVNVYEDDWVIRFREIEDADDEFNVTITNYDENIVKTFYISDLENMAEDDEDPFYVLTCKDLGLDELGPDVYGIAVNFTRDGEELLFNKGLVTVIDELEIEPAIPEGGAMDDVQDPVFVIKVDEEFDGSVEIFVDGAQVGEAIDIDELGWCMGPMGRQIILNQFNITEDGYYTLKVIVYDENGTLMNDATVDVQVAVGENTVIFNDAFYTNDGYITFDLNAPIADGSVFLIYLNGKLAGSYAPGEHDITWDDDFVDIWFDGNQYARFLKVGDYDVNVTLVDYEDNETDFAIGAFSILGMGAASDNDTYYEDDDVFITFFAPFDADKAAKLEVVLIKSWGAMGPDEQEIVVLETDDLAELYDEVYGSFTFATDAIPVCDDAMIRLHYILADDELDLHNRNYAFDGTDAFAITVLKLMDANLTIYVDDIVEGDSAVVIITTDDDFTGNVTVIIDDDDENPYNVTVENGIGSLAIPGLPVGMHFAEAFFAAPHYSSDSDETAFEVDVKPIDPNLTISVANIEEGNPAVVTITTNATFSGNVTVTIANKNYTVSVVNGKGTINVANLAEGPYTATAIFAAQGIFLASAKNTTFTVTKKPVTPAKKADKIKLTLKKVKVKKSAKKLVLRATLKINGKAVKGKKITFKFKGKKYKAKTNKKGVAKVTIKKKVLKKLKVGKKVKYQATYGKVTKKYTVKVKK